jgi:hypothetical protein
MNQAYIIEIGDKAVGLVVKEKSKKHGSSYRFYASEAHFLSLEGRIFDNPEKATKTALALHRASDHYDQLN